MQSCPHCKKDAEICIGKRTYCAECYAAGFVDGSVSERKMTIHMLKTVIQALERG
jgi:hypothetical protein